MTGTGTDLTTSVEKLERATAELLEYLAETSDRWPHDPPYLVALTDQVAALRDHFPLPGELNTAKPKLTLLAGGRR